MNTPPSAGGQKTKTKQKGLISGRTGALLAGQTWHSRCTTRLVAGCAVQAGGGHPSPPAHGELEGGDPEMVPLLSLHAACSRRAAAYQIGLRVESMSGLPRCLEAARRRCLSNPAPFRQECPAWISPLPYPRKPLLTSPPAWLACAADPTLLPLPKPAVLESQQLYQLGRSVVRRQGRRAVPPRAAPVALSLSASPRAGCLGRGSTAPGLRAQLARIEVDSGAGDRRSPPQGALDQLELCSCVSQSAANLSRSTRQSRSQALTGRGPFAARNTSMLAHEACSQRQPKRPSTPLVEVTPLQVAVAPISPWETHGRAEVDRGSSLRYV